MNSEKPISVKDLLHELICKIVDTPEAVNIAELKSTRSSIFEITVADDDVGKIIGKDGRTAQALRKLLQAISRTADKNYFIEIIDP